MVRTYKVSIREAEEECLRVQGQPERHSQTLLPNLKKFQDYQQPTYIHTHIFNQHLSNQHTFNQDTFIHIHSTKIYSYTYIQPRYIHTHSQPRYIHTHTFNQHTSIHIFNQDIFMYNQQPTVQSPISSKCEFTHQAHSTVNTAPTLRSQAAPVPSNSRKFGSFCCIHKYRRNQEITLARQGRGMDV